MHYYANKLQGCNILYN